jgi:hypothetical protein
MHFTQLPFSIFLNTSLTKNLGLVVMGSCVCYLLFCATSERIYI